MDWDPGRNKTNTKARFLGRCLSGGKGFCANKNKKKKNNNKKKKKNKSKSKNNKNKNKNKEDDFCICN